LGVFSAEQQSGPFYGFFIKGSKKKKKRRRGRRQDGLDIQESELKAAVRYPAI
jgi:hypothetical protein